MSTPRLLPDDAYPPFFTDKARDVADEALGVLIPGIPTEPGEYLDKDRDPWTLNPDGTWTDNEGVTRPVEYNPLLAINAPFARI